MKTVIRRAVAGGPRVDAVCFLMVTFWASSQLYNIYPLEAGARAPQGSDATGGPGCRSRIR